MKTTGMITAYMRGFNRQCILCAMIILGIAAPGSWCLGQQAENELEWQVKAAYVYNFTKFIYWEARKGTPAENRVTISVLGAEPIGEILREFSQMKTDTCRLLIKTDIHDLSDTAEPNMVFIGRSQYRQLASILHQIRDTDILTVSDIPDFARQGGMIGFFIENGKVKIEINRDAVEKAGLKISAKLLEIARITNG